MKKDCPALKRGPDSRKGHQQREASAEASKVDNPRRVISDESKRSDLKSPTLHSTRVNVWNSPSKPTTSPPNTTSSTHTEESTKPEISLAAAPSAITKTSQTSNGKPPSKLPKENPAATATASVSTNDTSTIKKDDKAPEKKRVPFPPFVDTHCHLEYVFDRYEHRGSFTAFSKMQNYPKNFDGCISTFCDPAAFSDSLGLWSEILTEPNVWGAFGIHPHNAKYYYSNGVGLEDKLLKCLEHSKCVAFGEIGLDYSDHSPSDAQTQREIFAHQLQLALPFSKPLVLHCRDAEEELYHILSKNIPSEWFIHLHCFTGNLDTAKRFLDDFPNLYLGVCGNVTNQRQANVRHVATEIPLKRLLIETDAPYMTPYNLPKAGRCRFSHPALAFYVAKEIARLRKSDLVDVLGVVRENTRAIYGV